MTGLDHHRSHHARRGFTIVEASLLTVLTITAVGVMVPIVTATGPMSNVQQSLANLNAIGQAHAMYASDSGGRQLTFIRDDLSTFGSSGPQAILNFCAPNCKDPANQHPPLVLGWGTTGDPPTRFLYQFPMAPGFQNNANLIQPIVFEGGGGSQYFGAFRLMNARPFHNYLDGRFYDPVFYAPNDVAHEFVSPVFGSPDEFVDPDIVFPDGGGPVAWSSYCMSPAAMFDPAVMAPDDFFDPKLNGWVDPWDLDDGFRAPGLAQAMYPDLKTFVMEHHWNQPVQILGCDTTDPQPCNPGFEPGTYGGCEPYYFNHSIESAPATLFYDLSTRLLRTREAYRADRFVDGGFGGLWSRDTPFGSDGYLSEYGADNTEISHHILTTHGILGRDTTNGGTP